MLTPVDELLELHEQWWTVFTADFFLTQLIKELSGKTSFQSESCPEQKFASGQNGS